VTRHADLVSRKEFDRLADISHQEERLHGELAERHRRHDPLRYGQRDVEQAWAEFLAKNPNPRDPVSVKYVEDTSLAFSRMHEATGGWPTRSLEQFDRQGQLLEVRVREGSPVYVRGVLDNDHSHRGLVEQMQPCGRFGVVLENGHRASVEADQLKVSPMDFERQPDGALEASCGRTWRPVPTLTREAAQVILDRGHAAQVAASAKGGGHGPSMDYVRGVATPTEARRITNFWQQLPGGSSWSSALGCLAAGRDYDGNPF
jgi:hypothetical protein